MTTLIRLLAVLLIIGLVVLNSSNSGLQQDIAKATIQAAAHATTPLATISPTAESGSRFKLDAHRLREIYQQGQIRGFQRAVVTIVGEDMLIVELLAPSSEENCGGLTVLECRYSVNKPGMAVILAGAQDVSITAIADFDRMYREVLQKTIEFGVIPLLVTIGGGSEVVEYNSVIVALAQEFRVPLVDYGVRVFFGESLDILIWQALQAVNQALDN